MVLTLQMRPQNPAHPCPIEEPGRNTQKPSTHHDENGNTTPLNHKTSGNPATTDGIQV